MIFGLDIFQIIKLILLIVFFFLGIWYLFPSIIPSKLKPFKWEESLEKDLISKALIKMEKSFSDKVRFHTIWLQIERLKKEEIQGAFAELGVYKGETARFIHEMDNTRKFFLFDTFEGFREQDLQAEVINDEKYSTKFFSDVKFDEVKQFIKGNENMVFVKGYFPDTTIDLNEEKYAFVHLDADLYLPTLAALNYFYQRLSAGGVIIIHDYNHNWDGVRKAVDEFKVTIEEQIIEIADWQGSAMIIKK